MVRMLNFVLFSLGVFGLTKSHIAQRRWRLFTYYTQLSNILALLSSLVLVVCGGQPWVTTMRYLAVCMLVMTALVTTCVLVPLSRDPKRFLWSGNGFVFHVLCPIASSASYVLLENHVRADAIIVPIVVTLVYGLIMLMLNAMRIVDGPYPFFKVYEQPIWASVMWVLILLVAITVVSIGVLLIA